EFDDINIDETKIENALVFSKKAMGNGKYEDLVDVVYIKLSAFDPAKTREMAEIIGTINTGFEKKDTGYVLIVVGRLGSSDPWLGIPTAWNQISHARVIIETGLTNFQVEPSQGTHFFQNLTSLRNSYMTVNPVYNDGLFRIEILDALDAVYEDDFLRHVHMEKPLQVVVDGKTGKGVILYNR
ncbi:MAG: phosphoenolpyruvate synthase, partial [Spirochaetales bacterium]|nr:phosphoenolpyruvate synthase [Spirochaetales bacterium]